MTLIVKNNETAQKFNLVRPSDKEDVVYRLRLFNEWLELTGNTVLTADLGAWRDHLLNQNYKVKSVQAMLSTTRERIRELTRSNEFIGQIRMALWENDRSLSPVDIELQLSSILRAMENNADARNSRLKATTIQDKMDDERLWLNDDGLWQELLANIGKGKPELLALRDTAIVALFLATGIRREELCNLTVDDAYQTFQGQAALLVREGKGNKQRAVPYGALWERFVVPYVNPWVDVVARTGPKPPLFQGFWKGWKKLRYNHLDPATVNVVLQEYVFERDGKYFHATPHALRRTYARMLFQDYGLGTEGIQQNMGHADIRTTQDYIGILDINFRTPSERREE